MGGGGARNNERAMPFIMMMNTIIYMMNLMTTSMTMMTTKMMNLMTGHLMGT